MRHSVTSRLVRFFMTGNEGVWEDKGDGRGPKMEKIERELFLDEIDLYAPALVGKKIVQERDDRPANKPTYG